MQENPFSPYAPATPATFTNRERELDLIVSHLRTSQRGNVAVSGPLGIGKTSLLRYVADPAVAAKVGLMPPEFAIVYMDTHSVTPFTADRFWRRVLQLVDRSGTLGLAAPITQRLARPELDIIDLEEFLDELADRKMALVLLLDEFEWALQAGQPAGTESRNFLAQMASLARRTPRVLSLVVATESPLVEAMRAVEGWRGSPFPTIFSSVALKPLAFADVDQLLQRATGGHGVSFSADDRAQLYSLSSGHPAALQAAAFSLYHSVSQGLGGDQIWRAAGEAARDALELGPASSSGPGEPLAKPADPAPTFTGNPPAGTMPAGPQPLMDGMASGQPPAIGLWLDDQASAVTVDGKFVESLTALEYNLLSLLYKRPGRLISRSEIIQQLWGSEFSDDVDESRVEKLISRLRRKIERAPNRPQHVRTVRGRGYRYVP